MWEVLCLVAGGLVSGGLVSGGLVSVGLISGGLVSSGGIIKIVSDHDCRLRYGFDKIKYIYYTIYTSVGQFSL